MNKEDRIKNYTEIINTNLRKVSRMQGSELTPEEYTEITNKCYGGNYLKNILATEYLSLTFMEIIKEGDPITESFFNILFFLIEERTKSTGIKDK
jgi:hypothetical protein